MKKYNWQLSDWPHFQYDLSSFSDILLAITEKSGLLKGKLVHLDKDLQLETILNAMVDEAIKTSEIEGEFLSRLDIRSSIKNKLGLSHSAPIHDKRAQGVAELMWNVRETFSQPLDKKMLFHWHALLMSGATKSNLQIASWRTHAEPMQIISGYYGKQTIHFEAPPSELIPGEMQRFITWFNDTAPQQANAIAFPAVRAAIAHLYFESIHPFEDGNGRIGRAIAEKALSQGFAYPVIFSLSQAIEAKKKAYYSALKQASYSNEITTWLKYFINIVYDAQNEAENQIDFILKKSRFFSRYEKELNERQLKVLRRMFDAGSKGFEGGMNARKYIAITHASKATATRDLQELHSLGALQRMGAGRSVRYQLKLEDVL